MKIVIIGMCIAKVSYLTDTSVSGVFSESI